MKRFLKRRWHSIPVALVSALLMLIMVAGGAFAANLILTDQTVTQTVNANPYGSITANDITMPEVYVGGYIMQTFEDQVVVELTEEGEDKYLHMEFAGLGPGAAYDSLAVTILTAEGLSLSIGVGEEFPAEDSILLTTAGTYTFDENFAGIAGSATGTLQFEIRFTLEDE